MKSKTMKAIEHDSYLSFVRFCLDDKAPVPPAADTIVWHDLLDWAKKQTIVGVCWRGMQRLSNIGHNKPTDDDVLEWMAVCTRIEKTSRKANERALWVYRTFLGEGFRSCLLKGQGNAYRYPEPLLRQSGDIDIYVEGGDDKVIDYVRTIRPKARAVYHHIDFVKTEGIPVEVHYRPSWMSCPWYNSRLQRFFEEEGRRSFANLVTLPGTDGEIAVPTWRMNVVFEMTHIAHHVLREGIGLRQIIDYYYLLSNHGAPTPDERRQAESDLRRMGLRKMGGAVMWVLTEVLGMPKQWCVIKPHRRCGRLLLHEMMAGGNFGKYDDRMLSGETSSQAKRNVQTLWRDLRMVFYFPAECLWEPYFRWYHYFWRKKHN